MVNFEDISDKEKEQEKVPEEEQEEDIQNEEELIMKWDDEEGFIELADLDEDLEIPKPVVKEVLAEEPMEWSFDSDEAPTIGNILVRKAFGKIQEEGKPLEEYKKN
ncbi:hypothetical protein RIF29_21482 [Crotalaria pallida]|uniref:Uncharacterized protein n=1 Tax=Crotalaria pallida TaxID=3830 RepID=A0AAN9F4U2_CROPI